MILDGYEYHFESFPLPAMSSVCLCKCSIAVSQNPLTKSVPRGIEPGIVEVAVLHSHQAPQV